MIELETKINLKADKTVVDTLESNQHSMNTKMEGLAEDISKLNKKLELMYSEDEAKADRASNVVAGVPEAADIKKTIKDILEHLRVDTEPEYITRMGAPRSDGSGRPIKVVLKNTEDRNALLRNKKSIRNMRVGLSESENFDPQNFFIMEDQTVLEREKENKLRALLKEKRETESGFKWMIYRGRVKRYYPKETTEGAEARPNHTQNTDGTRGATAGPRRVVSAPAAPARAAADAQ